MSKFYWLMKFYKERQRGFEFFKNFSILFSAAAFRQNVTDLGGAGNFGRKHLVEIILSEKDSVKKFDQERFDQYKID